MFQRNTKVAPSSDGRRPSDPSAATSSFSDASAAAATPPQDRHAHFQSPQEPEGAEHKAGGGEERGTAGHIITIGTHVQVRYKQGAKWVAADVSKVREDGTYDVKYCNKEVEVQVAPAMIRSLQPASSSDLSVGQRLLVWPTNDVQQLPCRVMRIQHSGLVDVVLDDGSKIEGLAASRFRFVADGEGGVFLGGEYAVGQMVEAVYPSERRRAMGKVVRVHDNGSYDIRFNDGTEEVFLFPEDISGQLTSTKSGPATALKEGQQVEALFGGKSTWYKGKVIGVHPNGSYDVLFEDGDKQLGMAADLVRIPKPPVIFEDANGAPRRLFKEDQVVEARYRGQAQFFHARIHRVNKDGSYDVVYDDNEVEACVPVEFIRSSKYDRIKEGEVVLGAKVEARSMTGLMYLPGTVTAIHPNETFDIEFTHGQKDMNIPRSHIRVLRAVQPSFSTTPSPTRTTTESSTNSSAPPATGFNNGNSSSTRSSGTSDGRPPRRATGYPGGASPAPTTNSKGGGTSRRTSAFDYMDDDPQFNSHAEEAPSASSDTRSSYPSRQQSAPRSYSSRPANRLSTHVEEPSGGRLSEGQKVEVRANGKVFEAKISRVNPDDTCNLIYSDGMWENAVPRDLIRPLYETGGRATQVQRSPLPSYGEGDRVEARYRGRTKYCAGVIAGVNRDDTYFIDYDNGEREDGVPADLIRLLEDVPAPRATNYRKTRAT